MGICDIPLYWTSPNIDVQYNAGTVRPPCFVNQHLSGIIQWGLMAFKNFQWPSALLVIVCFRHHRSATRVSKNSKHTFGDDQWNVGTVRPPCSVSQQISAILQWGLMAFKHFQWTFALLDIACCSHRSPTCILNNGNNCSMLFSAMLPFNDRGLKLKRSPVILDLNYFTPLHEKVRVKLSRCCFFKNI